MTKQVKRVNVFNGRYDDGDGPPINADEFLAWFSEKLAEIPGEYRDNAEIKIQGDTYYDSVFLTLDISYSRPETDEEEIEREAKKKSHNDLNRENELRILADLKRKYGC